MSGRPRREAGPVPGHGTAVAQSVEPPCQGRGWGFEFPLRCKTKFSIHMRLILSIEELQDGSGAFVHSCIRPTDDEERFGQVHTTFSQADEVARLTEVAQEVEKAVNAYYSKEVFPSVIKPNRNGTSLSGGLILASAEPLSQKIQRGHSSDNE